MTWRGILNFRAPREALAMASSCSGLLALAMASSSSGLLSKNLVLQCASPSADCKRRSLRVSAVQSSSSSHSSSVPKLEPFTQSRTSRWMRDRSLIEKAEHAIQDECELLDGDEAYKCWNALFEFEDMKHASEAECNVENHSGICQPLERLENLVRRSAGVHSLISNLSMLAFHRKKKEGTLDSVVEDDKSDMTPTNYSSTASHDLSLGQDSIPKTKELQEEEDAKLPESPFSRLLRRRSLPSLWFSTPA